MVPRDALIKRTKEQELQELELLNKHSCKFFPSERKICIKIFLKSIAIQSDLND